MAEFLQTILDNPWKVVSLVIAIGFGIWIVKELFFD